MRRSLPPAQSFEVTEEEDLVLDDRPTPRYSELVQAKFAFSSCVAHTLKIVGSVKLIVAEKFPGGTVKLVGSGLDRRVENSGSGATILGTKVGRLNLELLDSIHRRKNDKIRTVEEIDGIGIVIDAVEHVVVLRRPIAIGGKGTAGSIASSIRLGRVHSGGELREESKISSVQRKVVDVATVHHLADRGVLSLKNWNGTGDFHRLCHTPRLQFEIHQYVRADVHHDIGLGDGFKSLGGGLDLITADLHWAERITPVTSRGNSQGCSRALVRQRDLRTTDHCTRGIGDGACDGTRVYLGLEWENAENDANCENEGTAQNPGTGRSIHELSFELSRLATERAT